MKQDQWGTRNQESGPGRKQVSGPRGTKNQDR
jgi:hypothetical protein